jgi:hypothetical protein
MTLESSTLTVDFLYEIQRAVLSFNIILLIATRSSHPDPHSNLVIYNILTIAGKRVLTLPDKWLMNDHLQFSPFISEFCHFCPFCHFCHLAFVPVFVSFVLSVHFVSLLFVTFAIFQLFVPFCHCCPFCLVIFAFFMSRDKRDSETPLHY